MLRIRGDDRITVVFRRLVVVAALVAIVSAVHLVMTALGITSLAVTGLAFVLALVVLALIIDLGAIIYGAELHERRR